MGKSFLTTKGSFLNGQYVPAGMAVELDDAQVNGDEKNLAPLDGSVSLPIVQVAPLGPTGPNPREPQQIPPGTVQTAGGYVQPGVGRLVGELTIPGSERAKQLSSETTTDELQDLMDDATGGDADGNASDGASPNNDDDALVAGTVAEITADLGGKTDDELQRIRAAEVDRERPRQGVIKAIDEELKARKG